MTMGLMPDSMLERRYAISERFLAGEGIEIGALHYPLHTSRRATVRYVDRLDVGGLRLHYPELTAFDLVDVDIVDDGETLDSIGDGQLDFIIANHMLEHTENPLGTIRNHLRKIRGGGVLYYAVPDKRCGFDGARPLTSFEHLVRDDREGTAISRLDHLEEWVRLVDGVTRPDEVTARVRALDNINYSIHFHVWHEDSFMQFLRRASRYLGYAFVVAHWERNTNEFIAVLRKASPWKTLLTGSTPSSFGSFLGRLKRRAAQRLIR
jgi:SAM-dependent methyltransferase